MPQRVTVTPPCSPDSKELCRSEGVQRHRSDKVRVRGRALGHSGLVPAGLDGNPDPIVSVDRTFVLDLVAAAVMRTARDRRALVAIDGASGTGKSTFGDELADTLQVAGWTVVRASIDSFHRPRSERYRLGTGSPLGYYRDSHDLVRLQQHLLQPFALGAGVYRRAIFDEPSDRPTAAAAEPVPTVGILVFDGLFLHRPELVGYWDLSVFLTAESRKEAAWQEYLTRDLPEDDLARAVEVAARVERARRHRYVDGQALYEREARPRERANIVIENNELASPHVIALR
jgi:uridine kinase